MTYIIKKDGTKEAFDPEKIRKAIGLSAERIMFKMTPEIENKVIDKVLTIIDNREEVDVKDIHRAVELALDEAEPRVAKSYRDYRNYKISFVHIVDKVFAKEQSIKYIGDRNNANTDSALVSTKRSLIYGEFNKELFKKFDLTTEELAACKDGYIYVHDMSARRDSLNCCLSDIGNILKGGFEMGNIWYNEPKSLDVAFDVISDVILSAASNQYGGFTVPEIDKILIPYAEKSYKTYFAKYMKIISRYKEPDQEDIVTAEQDAINDVKRDFEQGWQGLEYKLNTVASSRGDYPFTTFTFGISTDRFGKMASETCLKVRMGGQGRNGNKKPVLFPKLVFLYDENLHGKDKELEYLFDIAIECSSKTMYPDYLSLSGDGYVPSMYKKYKKVISPMGCVEGKEVITYIFAGNLYVESFERMWARINSVLPDYGQYGHDDQNRIIDTNGQGLYIYNRLGSFTRVKYLIRNIQDEWLDISISNGRMLQVTTNHPFTLADGRDVYAKDLTTNDYIPIDSMQYSNNSYRIPESLAWLQGFMLCDGCYQNHSVFASIAATGEDDIKDYFIKAFQENFGMTPEAIPQERGIKGIYQDLRIYSDGNNNLSYLISYFTQLYEGVQKIHRHVPNEVFSYTEEGRYAFLAGMIDADGHINNTANGTKTHSTIIQIGSTNKELALQQMALAQSLGMNARIYPNHYSSNRPDAIRYRVEFYPNTRLINYIKCQKKINNWDGIDHNSEFPIVGRVTKITPISIRQYSYDVTTETEHFTVSGVYSHNCRAFLSPWWERGGMEPADENDEPVFVGRFNCGVVSLNFPMILAKSQEENKDFYEVLDYYLEMIRAIHKRTYDYLGEMRASTNPLQFCEGGFYGGNLKPDDKIRPLLKYSTFSYGITALNELNRLYNGKSIREDGNFPLEVMEYINNKLVEYKKEDGILYAIYGTPAESLCYTQVKQFRKKYGVIKNVSDRDYMSNSFHCHVSENITPIEKQDKEYRFWNLLNGGKIQYVKYPIAHNIKAIKDLVRRAMKMGFYEGVNLSLAFCDDCGHQELKMDVCPVCGSKNLTKIERTCGYLGYSRVKGRTRFNDGKMAEIADRVSM